MPEGSWPGGEPVPRPVADGWWVDGDGVRWERRGEGVALSRFRRLVGSPDVRVVLVTPERLSEVAVVGREALRRRVEPFLKGGGLHGVDGLDVLVGEFRDRAGRRMVVVEERC